MFRFLAEKNGLSPTEDIILDYSFPGHIELANAMITGITSMGVISEPLVSLAASRNDKIRPIISFNDEWEKLFGNNVPFAQTALLVHKQFAEENPELVEIYLQRLEESIHFVNQNSEEAASLIVKNGILPDEITAKKAIPGCNLRFTRAFENKKGIEEYFRVFYNFNPQIIGGKLPDETFYFETKSD